MDGRNTFRNSGARVANAIEQGRDAFRKQAWGQAFSHLATADRESSLAAADLIVFAQAALLTGREAEGADLLSRAHQAFLGEGDTQRAASSAFWLGFTWLINGELAKASGWLSRAGRLL